jgi:hypothetical protein
MTDGEMQAGVDALNEWLNGGGLEQAVADISAGMHQMAVYCASVMPYWSYLSEAAGCGEPALSFNEWRQQWTGGVTLGQ